MPFALTIRERLNSWAGRVPLMTLHPTREEVEASLLEWVKDNWRVEMGEELPEEQDPDDLIHEFFDYVLEEYDIAEVHEPPPALRRQERAPFESM